MSREDDLLFLKNRFGDPYVQSISKMRVSRIGGEAKRVTHIMRDPIMSHHSQDLPEKMIDGCILRDAINFYNALNDRTKTTIAEFLELSEKDVNPYDITVLVEAELAGSMINTLGIKNYAEYIRQKGFEDLVAFILAVGENMIKQIPVD